MSFHISYQAVPHHATNHLTIESNLIIINMTNISLKCSKKLLSDKLLKKGLLQLSVLLVAQQYSVSEALSCLF